jgi:PAS domain S-box-containing protein
MQQPKGGTMQQPINILIVDDEPRNLTVLETVLENPGYRLVRAGSADQALLALVAEEFALIILDIRMPGMTGFELAHTIKERRKTAQVPIIFLTAYYNEDQHVLEGYESGAVDYLHKPVNARVLRSKVAVFAELYRRQRQAGIANRNLLEEVSERRRAEDRLRELNDTLEQRVVERTAALHAQQRLYQSVTDNASVALFISDREHNCTFMNPAAEQLTGFRMEECRGRQLRDLLKCSHAAEMPTLLDARPADARLSSAKWQAEEVFVHRNGHPYDVALTVSVLYDESGAPTGTIMEAQDISQRKRAQAQLKDADRRKDEFLATLAHELRNPLAPVRNAVHFLHLKATEAPELKWARDVIDRQTKAMARLIDDLMDVSRISRGKIVLQREHVELAKVIENAIETSQPKIAQVGHEFIANVPSEPVLVDADLTRLAQVLLNLLNNAAKYTDPGGRIELNVTIEGQDVVMSVRDSGIGIPTEKLESIFEMFAQVEEALSRSRGGLGIGLNLAKRLVEMHGGTIHAHSDGIDKGSEFIVRLPIVVEPANDTERPNGNSHGKVATELRILVVEDNQDAAESLAVVLRLMGHNVWVAYDGEQAITLAEDLRPQVTLCDVGLPKLNGYDVARALRLQPGGESMLLIAVTGWGQEHDKRKTSEAGFDRHMVKPVDVHALIQVLESVSVPEGLPG